MDSPESPSSQEFLSSRESVDSRKSSWALGSSQVLEDLDDTEGREELATFVVPERLLIAVWNRLD